LLILLCFLLPFHIQPTPSSLLSEHCVSLRCRPSKHTTLWSFYPISSSFLLCGTLS
jgi:hypothetical protein